jgi:CHAT domain-containing protein/tetratricopeptide (TPR) repeat protein
MAGTHPTMGAPSAGPRRPPFARRRALLLAAALGAARAVAAAPAEPPALVPGETIAVALSLDDARRHALVLQAGALVQVELHEKGPRLRVTLADPGGAIVARREAASETLTSLRLLAVAATAGTHVLEVRASPLAGPGTYTIRLDEPRPARDRDRSVASADEDLAEAVRLTAASTAESRRQALVRIDAAEQAFRAAGDVAGEALALYQRGFVQFSESDPAASASLEGAAALFQTARDRGGEAAAVSELGRARLRGSDWEGARALFERAARLARESGERRALSTYTSNAGIAFARQGLFEDAIERFSAALDLATELGTVRNQARALNNLGSAHKELGDLRKSLEYYERALELFRSAGMRDGESMALGNLGGLHTFLGQNEQAVAFLEEALALAIETRRVEDEGRALNHLAMAHRNLGDLVRARELAERSAERRRAIGDRRGEAAALQTLGRVLHGLGDSEAGLERLGEALRLQQAIYDPYLESETLLFMAEVERDRGFLHGALRRAEPAVALVEAMRSAVTSPELRASFTAVEQPKYDLWIDLLMRLHEKERDAGHDAAALQVSERARARVLLEALVEARADIRQGVDAALLAQERTLQRRISETGARLAGVLGREDARQKAAHVRQELEALTDEYRRFQSRIRRESPRYAALTQPEPVSLQDIRRDLLDVDTVLVEFYLGDERSFVWAATPSVLVSQALPPRAEIARAARAVHELATVRQREPARAADADRRFEIAAGALGRLLLGGVAGRLGPQWAGKRLLVVASDALAYVPFAALSLAEGAASRPLAADHEIVFAPSASVLRALRQEHGAPDGGPTTVAVLADPVFDAEDPRVAGGKRVALAPAGAPVGLTRAAESLGRVRFTRLPFSRREAEGIASLVPKDALMKATDFAANRGVVASGSLGGRRIVHFATHGVLHSEHPGLSGLVLSLVDEKGAPRDGFLRMHEIYNLRLPADLVVLSACQTALGQEIRGEGLIGLTRGFMYAGARRVVASLWQVDDESTAELMKRFYRAMLERKLPPAAALRAAQVELAATARWKSPYHWAAFVLQGEWR